MVNQNECRKNTRYFSAADNIERIYINFAILGLEESTKRED